ncbi:LamG domain-containing protein [Couchioplanes caeruleus]|uniref:Uncharacterized protein n=2 Tax=Couchioplanes caeruleus TaxID=56438 RepID=A0A1K0FNK4_9ACTN|nr:hypothetical protein [Couchioplanes caeruleus]OJF14421.1 hypothetical protein BG844_09990 [Couchioplanes caeruleus subsp. caeruleus]
MPGTPWSAAAGAPGSPSGVDGRCRGSTTVPATLSVSNTIPLSIGGKGAYRDNDQFPGALDDVWVAIG